MANLVVKHSDTRFFWKIFDGVGAMDDGGIVFFDEAECAGILPVFFIVVTVMPDLDLDKTIIRHSVFDYHVLC
jgi:hypothetical protein